MIRRLDAEPELEAAVLVDAATRYAIAVKFVADDEGALAPERPGEGANVAVERELLQHDAPAGAGVGERDASVLDLKTRDGERVRSESRRCSGPVDRACAVDAETDLRRHQAQLRGLHPAAQQRAKPDFEVDHAGPQLRLPAGFTDFDLAEPDSRTRQNAGFYGAVDANGETGQPAGLFLERRTVVIPIDDKRSDQRRHERQNDSYGQSEQCRLHRVSDPRDRAVAPEPKARLERFAPQEPHLGGICGRFCVGFLSPAAQCLDFEVGNDVRRGLAREAPHGITGG